MATGPKSQNNQYSKRQRERQFTTGQHR
jgi:hypothetical protein